MIHFACAHPSVAGGHDAHKALIALSSPLDWTILKVDNFSSTLMADGSSHTPKKACTHFLFCVPLLQVHLWFIHWQHQGMPVQACRARLGPGSWAARAQLPNVLLVTQLLRFDR